MMSSIDSGSMRRMSCPAELDARPGADAQRLVVHVRRGREILDGQSQRLEECDLVLSAAPRTSPDQQLADFRDDVFRTNVAVVQRHENVAWFLERGFAAVDV